MPRAQDYAAFYSQQFAGVLALVYSLVGNWAVAEDLAQEAFMRAYRDWERISSYDRPDAWVRTVAVNAATSRFRRLAAEARAVTRLAGRARTTWPDPLPEDLERFWVAVRRLPIRQAQAAALHYGEDRSIADIARIMGCAEGTVKTHLHQARRTLAQRLGLTPEGGAAS